MPEVVQEPKAKMRVLKWLKRNKVSQKWLARRLAVDYKRLNHYMCGVRAMPGRLAREIEDLTGVPMRAWYPKRLKLRRVRPYGPRKPA